MQNNIETADHLRTTLNLGGKLKPHKLNKIEWPPNEWWDSGCYPDEEARLPTCLYPYYITKDRESHIWSVKAESKDPRGQVIETGFTDIFSAFERMLSYYKAWFPTRPIEQVYFIGTELKAGHDVKIGHSLYPKRRLKALQTASPDRLKIFATTEGGRRKEEYYHRRWHARRRSGEWFTLGECIIKEIERLAQ